MNDRLAPVLSLKTKVNGAKHKVEENGGRSKTKSDRPQIFDVTSNKNNKFAAADLLAVLRHLRCFLRTESSRGQRVIHLGM